jgi:hypothetical protein
MNRSIPSFIALLGVLTIGVSDVPAELSTPTGSDDPNMSIPRQIDPSWFSITDLAEHLPLASRAIGFDLLGVVTLPDGTRPLFMDDSDDTDSSNEHQQLKGHGFTLTGTIEPAEGSGDITPTLPGDLSGDGVVDVMDMLMLLEHLGRCSDCSPVACPADLNNDCSVDLLDLLMLLGNRG